MSVSGLVRVIARVIVHVLKGGSTWGGRNPVVVVVSMVVPLVALKVPLPVEVVQHVVAEGDVPVMLEVIQTMVCCWRCHIVVVVVIVVVYASPVQDVVGALSVEVFQMVVVVVDVHVLLPVEAMLAVVDDVVLMLVLDMHVMMMHVLFPASVGRTGVVVAVEVLGDVAFGRVAVAPLNPASVGRTGVVVAVEVLGDVAFGRVAVAPLNVHVAPQLVVVWLVASQVVVVWWAVEGGQTDQRSLDCVCFIKETGCVLVYVHIILRAM